MWYPCVMDVSCIQTVCDEYRLLADCPTQAKMKAYGLAALSRFSLIMADALKPQAERQEAKRMLTSHILCRLAKRAYDRAKDPAPEGFTDVERLRIERVMNEGMWLTELGMANSEPMLTLMILLPGASFKDATTSVTMSEAADYVSRQMLAPGGRRIYVPQFFKVPGDPGPLSVRSQGIACPTNVKKHSPVWLTRQIWRAK